ncbi:MAG: hypothetical protein ABS52_07740 [Gemmatimonadetes bacterium SCN 70-22]|nr:MAG: hypothetical protein ABS52_07740 [Gemmatimonadetes bacterium SCN 70-22]
MSVGELALFFLPQSAYPLAIVALALGVIVGFLPVSKAVRLMLLLAFLPILTTVMVQVLAMFPWYVAAGLFLFVLLSVVRGVLELFLGREAAGHVLGWMVVSCIRLAFRIAVGALRLGVQATRRVAYADPRRLN